MKFLLDQNLSPRLIEHLEQDFPGTRHVRDFDLQRAGDQVLWDFAKANGFAILSKDSDFHHMSFLRGHPPKVVWVDLGNCTTKELLEAIRRQEHDLEAFQADDQSAFLRLL